VCPGTLIGLVVLFPTGRPGTDGEAAVGLRLAGHVAATVETACDASSTDTCMALTVRMAEGPLAGRDIVTV
jgi:hypothetical protein